MKNAFKLVLKKATAVLLVTLLVVTQSLENIYASEKNIHDIFNQSINQEIIIEEDSENKSNDNIDQSSNNNYTDNEEPSIEDNHKNQMTINNTNDQENNNEETIENALINLTEDVIDGDINSQSETMTITANLTFKLNNQIDTNAKGNYYIALFNQSDSCVSSIEKLDICDGEATIEYTNAKDQNGNDIDFNYSDEYYVYILELKPGKEYSDRYDQNIYDKLKSGDVLSDIYKIKEYEFPIKLSESNKTPSVDIYAEANGTKLTLNTLNSSLGISKNFGAFTNEFKKGPDIESNIAANTANISGDYNFSTNNTRQLNHKIKVTKTYKYSNNSPVKNETVKFRLYKKNGTEQFIEQKEGTTGDDGKVTVEFNNLKDGIYSVSEVINGQEIKETCSNIKISDTEYLDVTFNNNENIGLISNYSYINKVEENFGFPREGSTVVINDNDDYEKYKDYNARPNVNIIKAGTNGFDIIDFAKEFDNLSLLSKTVSTALPSDSIKVIYLDYKDLTSDLNIQDEGKYVVVNVDMSGAPDSYTWPGQYKINGKQVDSGWNPDVTRILWNFYDYKDDKPYDGTITTGGTTSGIILAPKSKVNSASGNHVGTIIADEINHTTGEIHFIIYGTWKESNVTVTNTKRGEEKEVGKLFIKKELGQGTEMSEDEEFIIKVKADFRKGIQETLESKIDKDKIRTAIEVPGVIYGETYKVSEDKLEGYTVTIDNKVISEKDVTMDKEDQTVTVTNTKTKKEVGKLFIKKELGQGTEMSANEEFIIKVTGRFSDTDKTEKEFKIKKADIGTAIKVSGVIYGETYKISENELKDYTVTIDQPEVKMNDTNQTVTVTNTKKTVEKPESTVGKPESTVEKPESTVEKPESTVEKPESTVEKPESTVEKPESNDIDNDTDIDIDNDIVKTGDKNIYDYLCIILIATISILIIKFNDDKKYSDKKN